MSRYFESVALLLVRLSLLVIELRQELGVFVQNVVVRCWNFTRARSGRVSV